MAHVLAARQHCLLDAGLGSGVAVGHHSSFTLPKISGGDKRIDQRRHTPLHRRVEVGQSRLRCPAARRSRQLVRSLEQASDHGCGADVFPRVDLIDLRALNRVLVRAAHRLRDGAGRVLQARSIERPKRVEELLELERCREFVENSPLGPARELPTGRVSPVGLA
ncbi:MAG TPA: hypothetical protein VGN83_18715 [Falsiroseomonas sp.]|nr:hypothetical protein [Falsiroseomonas sp.]